MTLASWLLAPAAPAEGRARQAAVAQLRDPPHPREDPAPLRRHVPARVDFGAVGSWGAPPPILGPRWPRWRALVLGVTTLTSLIGWLAASFGFADADTPFGAFFLHYGSVPFVLAGVLQLALAGWLLRRVHA